jgi:putative Ca2+/H+ antiporter (TMEM165/GDT1 family)
MVKQAPKGNPSFRENLGKMLLDMAKLTFGSFILGGILKGEVPQYLILIIGGVLFVILAVMGLWFSSTKTQEE